MDANSYLFIATGLILALAGFGYYAIEVWKAYNEEKRKIEEDFQLSEKYDAETSRIDFLILLLTGSTSIFFVLVLIIIMLVSDKTDKFPLASRLVSQFILLLGATSVIGDVARIPNDKNAMKEFVYMPRLPEDIKNEKDIEKRYSMIKEFTEKHGLKYGREHFGRYVLFHTLPEYTNIQIFGVGEMLAVFTGLIRATKKVNDISPNFASSMLAVGILYVVLVIPTIFSMKKSAEIEMSTENLQKKMLAAVYGFVPSILGLIIMIYAMLPLLE